MDKTIKIVSFHQEQNDYQYWMKKSPLERLEAIEFLRQQYIKFRHANGRLQRVCSVITKA